MTGVSTAACDETFAGRSSCRFPGTVLLFPSMLFRSRISKYVVDDEGRVEQQYEESNAPSLTMVLHAGVINPLESLDVNIEDGSREKSWEADPRT